MAIDAIFTHHDGCGFGGCCFGVAHGFGYGVNSNHKSVCLYTATNPAHRVLFVDNDFKKYDHAKHLNFVAQHQPKYATVQDIMAFNQLEQTLVWAEELAQYSEKVIVIPKVDCIADIPEQYVLGYAVETSYGGTDLPYSVFGNRPVHLLGGAWRQQRDIIRNSRMNIVSLDFNHICKIARGGLFNDRFGLVDYRLSDAMPSFSHRPLHTCLALSLAAIGYELLQLESHKSC